MSIERPANTNISPQPSRAGLPGNTARLTFGEWCLAFGLKLLLGLLYGYVFLHYFAGDDTWAIHRAAAGETRLLQEDPNRFFTDGFTPLNAWRTGRSLLEAAKIYREDLEYTMLVKSMALANLLTGGNYYGNVIVYNALTFGGSWLIFTVFCGMFPDSRRLLFAAVFLFLPAVFWTSGIRPEGMILQFFAFFLAGLHHLWPGHDGRHLRAPSVWLLSLIVGGLGVAVLRPPFAVLMIVAAVAYLVAVLTSWRHWRAVAIVYGIAAVVFFGSGLVLPTGGLPAVVVDKQRAFFSLQGTAFRLDSLSPDPVSFAKILPQSLSNTMLRPFIWEAQTRFQQLAALETVAVLLVIMLALWKRHPDWGGRLSNPLVLFALTFAASAIVFTGYVVPFPGAIVRYKSIPELILLCVLAVMVRTTRKPKNIY